jgi:hypothetical protein
MHRGVLLAAVTIALFLIGLVVWLIVEPMLGGTYAVTMQQPKTHQVVVCQASFVPAYRAFEAVEVCQARCDVFGFRRIDGRPVSLILDMSLSRIEQKWGQFIPSACKPKDMQRLIREEAAHNEARE